jgi:hypothetical protein
VCTCPSRHWPRRPAAPRRGTARGGPFAASRSQASPQSSAAPHQAYPGMIRLRIDPLARSADLRAASTASGIGKPRHAGRRHRSGGLQYGARQHRWRPRCCQHRRHCRSPSRASAGPQRSAPATGPAPSCVSAALRSPRPQPLKPTTRPARRRYRARHSGPGYCRLYPGWKGRRTDAATARAQRRSPSASCAASQAPHSATSALGTAAALHAPVGV